MTSCIIRRGLEQNNQNWGIAKSILSTNVHHRVIYCVHVYSHYGNKCLPNTSHEYKSTLFIAYSCSLTHPPDRYGRWWSDVEGTSAKGTPARRGWTIISSTLTMSGLVTTQPQVTMSHDAIAPPLWPLPQRGAARGLLVLTSTGK